MNLKQTPIIIQATNRSDKMENKTIKTLVQSKSVLEYLVNRLQKSGFTKLLISTSIDRLDDSIVDIANSLDVSFYRGSPDNLVDRLLRSAEILDCASFVRVFGSYPLLDIEAMKSLINHHRENCSDYAYNGHRRGVIWGMECEVFSVHCLERVASLGLNRLQLEAVSFFVRQNTELFNQYRMDVPLERQQYKVALENEKDLMVISDVASNVKHISHEKVAAYLDAHPIIAFSNHETPSKEVGLEKLMVHHEKISTLLEASHSIDSTYPISVELSITNNCNLKCVYCSDNDLRNRQGIAESLTKEALFRFFDQLKAGGTKGVVIEGGGEPTIHPDFEEIIGAIAERGLAVGLITNGTKRMSPELLKLFEWIRVSLDASTAQEYYLLKGVDAFERVLSNIHYYAEHCKTVGVGYVVTNNNISAVEPLVQRMREFGISYIQFRPVVDSPELYPEGEDLSYLHFYQTKEFAIITDGMKENASTGNGDLPCVSHSLTTVITADGSVYLCGRLNIHSWIQPIGNINENSFDEIWTGDERIKQALMVGDAEFCKKHCPQCRITKYNRLVRRLTDTKTPNFI